MDNNSEIPDKIPKIIPKQLNYFYRQTGKTDFK